MEIIRHAQLVEFREGEVIQPVLLLVALDSNGLTMYGKENGPISQTTFES